MPWMRVAIGVGFAGLVAGVAGMSFWIDDGSHYFELAAALASSGFLTLVTCVLTKVFGSSHGSQDDAFTRGRSMGYDAGFLEGHRIARPVVVPLHAVDPGVEDLQVPFNVIDHTDEASAKPLWGRDVRDGAKARMVAWVGARRTPLLAGAMCLALVGAVFAGALVRRPAPESPSQVPVGALINRPGPPSGTSPALVGTPAPSPARHAVVAGAAPGAPVKAGRSPVAGGSGVGAVPAALSSGTGSGLAVAAPGAVYLPAAARPVAAPAAAPVAAAPAVPLTAAQQTAADAAAAAALTAKNAKAAADLTAANAAAAAAATAKAAADAAWAVAHPKP